ncbi:hypothetical protein VTN00DRAFT_754 [Thermoascus crustaceus]|uniref:uncharacterized protein n=1 Tax=Thermoascus crustaceus TaxID=5088 RepID=UPI003744431E
MLRSALSWVHDLCRIVVVVEAGQVGDAATRSSIRCPQPTNPRPRLLRDATGEPQLAITTFPHYIRPSSNP